MGPKNCNVSFTCQAVEGAVCTLVYNLKFYFKVRNPPRCETEASGKFSGLVSNHNISGQ